MTQPGKTAAVTDMQTGESKQMTNVKVMETEMPCWQRLERPRVNENGLPRIDLNVRNLSVTMLRWEGAPTLMNGLIPTLSKDIALNLFC